MQKALDVHTANEEKAEKERVDNLQKLERLGSSPSMIKRQQEIADSNRKRAREHLEFLQKRKQRYEDGKPPEKTPRY